MQQGTKVLVHQLPLGTTSTAMRALFEACGDVLEVLILGTSHEVPLPCPIFSQSFACHISS